MKQEIFFGRSLLLPVGLSFHGYSQQWRYCPCFAKEKKRRAQECTAKKKFYNYHLFLRPTKLQLRLTLARMMKRSLLMPLLRIGGMLTFFCCTLLKQPRQIIPEHHLRITKQLRTSCVLNTMRLN